MLTALALMLIIEGLLPFLAPGLWRETFRTDCQLERPGLNIAQKELAIFAR